MEKEDYKQVLNWTGKGNVGVSSNTMLVAVTGESVYGINRDTPRDKGDFGRCVELVIMVDIVRENIHLVKDTFPEWTNIIDNWDYLVTCYWDEKTNFHKELKKLEIK